MDESERLEAIKEEIEKEYKEFKMFTLTQANEEVYNNAGNIHIYVNIADYFKNMETDEDKIERTQEQLLDMFFPEDKDEVESYIMATFWNMYIEFGDINIATCAGIVDLIDNMHFCYKEHHII